MNILNIRDFDRIFMGWFPAILILLGTVGLLHAGVQTPDLQAALQALPPEDEVRVIVKFAQRVDVESLRHLPRPLRRSQMVKDMKTAAEQSQREVRSFLSRRGVKEAKNLWVVNGMAFTARPETIQGLADRPDVLSVQIDRAIHKSEVLLQNFAPPEPNITQIGASDLWPSGYLGQGAVVGLMDTGADVNHPDLAGTWRGGANSWFDPYNVHPALPFDNDGHGTAVLGVMVGGDFGGTTIGVAPAAKWIAGKMFNDDGFTYYSVIHQLFQWFLDPDGDPDTDDAPDVVNGSWGFESPDLVGQCFNMFPADFQLEIDALNAAGIAVVFAAGNAGPNPATSISPANYPGVIAAGSVNNMNVIENSSSRGPSACDQRIYPDVVAPGVGIVTTDLSFGGIPNYAAGTGTSFSAPHVSGMLALLRSAFPGASLDQVKTALTSTASHAAAPDQIYGYGVIDGVGAFNYLAGQVASCVQPDIDISASPYPASPNQPITFSSSVSGGTPDYRYAWDFNADGVTDCVEAACVQTYPAGYAGSVGLTVTDATGCSSTLFIANGWAACTPNSASFTVSPAAPVTGQTVTYTSSVTGGNAPFSYEWDLDADGLVDCTTAACTRVYSAVFNGTVTLRVTDRYSCPTVVYAAPVSVAAAPPSSGGGGGGGGGPCFIAVLVPDYRIPPYFWAIAISLIGLGTMAVRRRAR